MKTQTTTPIKEIKEDLCIDKKKTLIQHLYDADAHRIKCGSQVKYTNRNQNQKRGKQQHQPT